MHLALCTCTSLPGVGIKMSSVFVPFTTSGFTRLEINVRTAVAQSSSPTDPDVHGKQRENHRCLRQLLISSVCTLFTGKIESRKIKKKKATIKAREQKKTGYRHHHVAGWLKGSTFLVNSPLNTCFLSTTHTTTLIRLESNASPHISLRTLWAVSF